MKFDCGETWEEQQTRLSSWHPFYAVLPKRVAPHDCRWLEWIERKGTLVPTYYCYDGTWSVEDGVAWEWEYRAAR